MDFKDQYILLSKTPLGDIQIRYYGIIIVVAMLVAAFVAARLASRRKLNPDHVWGGLTWAIFPGIVGARLWFIVFPPVSLTAGCGIEGGICQDFGWFLQNFFNTNNGAIAVWTGGLSIFGAVIGGLLGTWLYCSKYHNRIAKALYALTPLWIAGGFILLALIRSSVAKEAFDPVKNLIIPVVLALVVYGIYVFFQRRSGATLNRYGLPPFTTDFPDEGIPLLPWLDIAAVVMPLAQAIGRWANFVNQELYGTPTTLPWGITIDQSHRVGAYASMVEYNENTLFHPLFLYEALWSLIAFFVLLNIYQRRRIGKAVLHTGDLALLYLMQYSFIRFVLEFMRVEIATIPGTSINSSQAICVLVFVAAAGAFFYRRRNAAAPETPAEVTGGSQA